MGWLRFGALAVLLSLCSRAGTASADDGAAAVLPFQGAQAAKVRKKVHAGLQAKGVTLVSLNRVNAVVKRTKGYARQASALDARILIRARIRRVEGRWIADAELRNAKGQRIEKLRTSSSSLTRLSNRIVAQLVRSGRLPTQARSSQAAPAPAVETAPPAPTEPRLVVRPFKGAQAAKIRGGAVRGLLDQEVELYPNKQFVAKAKSLGADLRSEGGHVAPAEALAVSGLFEGDVMREDGVWSAYVRLVDGHSKKVISQHFYEASSSTGLAKAVRAAIGSDFRKDIKKLGFAPPVAVMAAPAEQAEAQAAPEAAQEEVSQPAERSKPPRKQRPAAVDIEVDFRIVHRSLGYNDDIRGELRDYTLNLGPGMGVKFQYYPGAHFTAGVGAQFGIDFEWESLFKFDSTRADGQTFPTESQQFLVGARWRYPIRRWEPSLALDYGIHTFELGVSGPPVPGEDNTPGVPSVRYQFVRIAPGFRVGIGAKQRFIVAASLGFRGVFSVGGIASDIWFPEAKANGMDAMLMIGFALPKGFEIRLGGDYRRYWFDLNPVPPDAPRVAGGALDQYWGGSFGLAWRW